MNGKGDRYRPYDPEVFGNEHERIFGKKVPAWEQKPEQSQLETVREDDD